MKNKNCSNKDCEHDNLNWEDVVCWRCYIELEDDLKVTREEKEELQWELDRFKKET